MIAWLKRFLQRRRAAQLWRWQNFSFPEYIAMSVIVLLVVSTVVLFSRASSDDSACSDACQGHGYFDGGKVSNQIWCVCFTKEPGPPAVMAIPGRGPR